MKKKILAAFLGLLAAPTFILASHDTSETFGSDVVEFFVGEPCLVPVYHTNFSFPPEGGQIIQKGDELFFHKNYLPGCGMPSGAVVVTTRGSQPTPALHPQPVHPNPTPPNTCAATRIE